MCTLAHFRSDFLMQNSKPKKRFGLRLAGSGAFATLMIIVGIVLWGGFNTAMEATNTENFCISCHEMESTVYQEYKHSVHAGNPSGVRASCPDCHVPKEWGPKVIRKIQASAEVYHWLVGSINTQEKFEARRPYLANKVWGMMKETDSRECRNCHEFDSMDLEGQARFAAKIHSDGILEGKTCIDCHKGIAHQLPKLELAETSEVTQDDLDYGEEINETCAGCHGANAEGSADGEYPRLAGMSIPYLVKQLDHFKARERLNIPMVPYTNERELPEEDTLAIAAYLSSIKLPTRLPSLEEDQEEEFNALGRLRASLAVVNIPRHDGNIAAGGRTYRKECATCHGDKGQGSPDGLTPPLAGQHILYLVRQLELFKKSERVHSDPRDAAVFQLFGAQEINDIMAFLSVQDD